MAISQEVLLAVYGELTDLRARIDQLDREIMRGDYTRQDGALKAQVAILIQRLNTEAEGAQRRAINKMMDADDSLAFDPISGEVEGA